MNLAPLLDAPLAIQIHVAAVIPAALTGPWMFWSRKGSPWHRLVGKVWFGLMVLAALSSFFIHEINLFLGLSPIHLISVFVLVNSWLALKAAREHRVMSHKRKVVAMYLGGIVGAGVFTLLPGRIMNKVVFTYPAGWPDTVRLGVFLALMAGITLLLLAVARMSASKRA
jgi:uncharacterized membrane protein